MTFAPANSESPFLPTTLIFSTEQEKFYSQLSRMYADVALRLNTRAIGNYITQETLSGKKFSDPNAIQLPRDGFRTIFFFGAIAAGATLTTAHNITGFSTLTFTDISGTAVTAAGSFNKIPLPYVSATTVTDQVQLDADDTNFRIINGSTASNISSGYVILEYLKN